MTKIPDTTRALLNALREHTTVERIVIEKEGFFYFPTKTRDVKVAIEKSGTSDLVQKFVTHTLSHTVASHFRLGTYDLKGSITVVR